MQKSALRLLLLVPLAIVPSFTLGACSDPHVEIETPPDPQPEPEPGPKPEPGKITVTVSIKRGPFEITVFEGEYDNWEDVIREIDKKMEEYAEDAEIKALLFKYKVQAIGEKKAAEGEGTQVNPGDASGASSGANAGNQVLVGSGH